MPRPEADARSKPRGELHYCSPEPAVTLTLSLSLSPPSPTLDFSHDDITLPEWRRVLRDRFASTSSTEGPEDGLAKQSRRRRARNTMSHATSTRES